MRTKVVRVQMSLFYFRQKCGQSLSKRKTCFLCVVEHFTNFAAESGLAAQQAVERSMVGSKCPMRTGCQGSPGTRRPNLEADVQRRRCSFHLPGHASGNIP